MSIRKQLFLFRHAEAIEKSSRLTDKERELTPTGMRQSIEMGTYLAKQVDQPQIIFSSSAMRTRQTTMLSAEAMKFSADKIMYEDELYDASTRTFLEFVRNIDSTYDRVMCVGHNPTISYLAEFLTKKEIGDMALAGIVVIGYEFSLWSEVGEGKGTLLSYVHPANIR